MIVVKDGQAKVLRGGARLGNLQRFGTLGCNCQPAVRQGKKKLGLIVVDNSGRPKIKGLGSLGAASVQTAPVGSQASQAASGGTVLVYKATLPIASASTPSVTAGGKGWSASGLPAVTAPPAPAPVAGTSTPAPSTATVVPPGMTAQQAAAFAKISGKSNLSGLGQAVTGASVTVSTLRDASLGASAGSFFPVIGTAIGAVVGAIIGIASSIFGGKSTSPPVTAAQIAQAQSFLSQYQQVAGTIVGRAFSQSQMQDIAISFAIAKRNPGDTLTQQAIGYVWAEYTARLNQLFSAMAAAPIGNQISLSDIKGIPGHPNDFNPNLFYTFTNPGVNAPSDIVGLIFAQLQYAIDCCLYVGTKDVPGLTTQTCAALYLYAPYPQFACDLVDWYRASIPAWDVTGAVVATEDQTLSLPAPAPAASAPAVGSPASIGAPAAAAAQPTPVASTINPAVPVPSPVAASTPVVASPTQQIVSLPSVMGSPAVASTPVAPQTVGAPTVGAQTLSAPSGLSLSDMGLIAGAGLLAYLLLKGK
jgi:hypothetical protein